VSGAVQRLGYSLGYSRGGTALILDRLLFRPDISPVATDRAGVMRCRRSLPLVVGRCCCCHRCCHPRDAPAPGPPSPLGCGRECAAPLPIGLTAAGYSLEGRCQGWLRVYVNQAVSPVLVILRAQPPLMPYRRRITIPRQFGGGFAASPVMSPWSRRSLSGSIRRAFPSTVPAVGIASLEGVWRTVVRATELETLMLLNSRSCTLLTVVNGPAISKHAVGLVWPNRRLEHRRRGLPVPVCP
jgi:hypothetical protein